MLKESNRLYSEYQRAKFSLRILGLYFLKPLKLSPPKILRRIRAPISKLGRDRLVIFSFRWLSKH
jgi:hypothetical protein